MKRSPPLSALALALLALAGSCIGNDSPTGVDGRRVDLHIPLQPTLIPSAADGGAAPIERIRVLVARISDNVVLGESEIDVDPAATSWEITVSAALDGTDPVEARLFLYLLSLSGDVETVEFSGYLTPVSLVPGEEAEIANVPMLRGPVANFFVTGVTIDSYPDTLTEGSGGALSAQVGSSAEMPPVVFWTALDSAVLSVSDSTVTAVGWGLGRVVASAGTFADTAEVYVIPRADLSVTKRVVPSTAAEGDTVDFEVVVANGGSGAVAGASLLDSVPAGVTVLTTTPTGSFDQAIGAWRWTLDTIVGGGADTITMRTLVDPGTAGDTLVNVARVAAPTGVVDPDAANDRATAALAVSGGAPANLDLLLFATANDSTPSEGDTVRIVVSLSNVPVGPTLTHATGISVTHGFGAGLTLLGAAPALGAYDTIAGVWTVDTLPADISTTLTLDVEVEPGTVGQTLSESMWVSGLDQIQSSLANDTATVSLVVQQRSLDVEVAKTVDEPQPLADSSVVFTVSVINHGPGDATGIAVFDSLQSVFQSPQHAVSTGALVGDTLWTIATLAQGDTATWTTTATVASTAGGTTPSNTAILRAVAQNDSVAANDTAVVSMSIPTSAIPVVTISTPPDSSVFDPGDPVTFTAAASDAEEGDLSTLIQWTSSRDGSLATGRSFTTTQLSTGVHTIVAAATDSTGGTGADSIQVTIALIAVPATLNVPFGGTASLPITLTGPAPPGGVTLDVVSDDPSVTTPASATVFIPAGALSTNASMSGIVPGTAVVTVSSPGYGAKSTTVAVTAELDILTTSLNFPEAFTDDATVQFESQGVPIAAPAGGLQVTMTAADPTCVNVGSPITIPAGQISTTATFGYGGSAQLNCQSYVYASATSVVIDSVLVTVAATPTISANSYTVGSGLMRSAAGSLGATAHGGVTLTLTSSNDQQLLLSPDQSTPGTASIQLQVPDGSQSFSYFVHGVEGATGTPTVTASATGFNDGTNTINVVQPVIRIAVGSFNTTTLSPDAAIYAYVGVPSGTAGVFTQNVRAGGNPVTVSFGLDDPQVGLLTDGAVSQDTVTATIQPGLYYTPFSVASGGVAFVPQSPGTTNIGASAPGFGRQTTADITATVTAPTITVNSYTVGSGLMRSAAGSLGATAHGGVTLTLTSSNDQQLLLSPDQATPGTASIQLQIPDGSQSFTYYVQGVEGATGAPTVTASATNFNDGTNTIDVVQPVIRIAQGSINTTTLSPDAVIYAYVGVPSGTTGVFTQNVRAGGSPVTVSFGLDDPQVGLLTDGVVSQDTVTATIPVGLYYTPFNVASGGVAFVPGNPGTTNIGASAPGFGRQTTADITATVTAPTISVNSYTVGSGLIRSAAGSLGATAHGGVTLTLTSSNDQQLLLSPDQTTPGTASIQLQIPDGSQSFTYYVQGVEGATGTPTVTASATNFNDGTNTINVVQPAIRIAQGGVTTTTLSPDPVIYAYIGIPSGSSGVLTQNVRPGGNAVTVAFGVTDTQVGLMTDGVVAQDTVTATIPVGLYYTPFNVASGGVAFVPQSPGTTNVGASATGFVRQTTADITATVSAPNINVNSYTVGSGLIRSAGGSLGASAHGGVTVTLTSSDPQTLVLSNDPSTPGTTSIQFQVADGSQSFTYYVQGVEGATGTAVVTATASGFNDGTNTITVVQPAIRLSVGPFTTTTQAADRAVYAYIGIPSGTSGVSAQNVRPGGSPVTVTAISSNPAAARLVTSATAGSSVTATIVAGSYLTPTTVAGGGFAIDPLDVGQTTIAVSASGFTPQSTAAIVVTINP